MYTLLNYDETVKCVNRVWCVIVPSSWRVNSRSLMVDSPRPFWWTNPMMMMMHTNSPPIFDEFEGWQVLSYFEFCWFLWSLYSPNFEEFDSLNWRRLTVLISVINSPSFWRVAKAAATTWYHDVFLKKSNIKRVWTCICSSQGLKSCGGSSYIILTCTSYDIYTFTLWWYKYIQLGVNSRKQ